MKLSGYMTAHFLAFKKMNALLLKFKEINAFLSNQYVFAITSTQSIFNWVLFFKTNKITVGQKTNILKLY